MSEQYTLEVTLEGEEVATHTTEGGTTHRLFRTPEGLYRIHWQDEEQAWLETGKPGSGVSVETLRALFPELAAAAELD